jgi:hypothetical protein
MVFMHRLYHFRQRLAILIITFASAFNSNAQVSNTFYHMYGIPQANQLNPAFQSECNIYFGFPMLSPLSINIESNPLSYKDIFSYNSQLDAMITFMHPDADKADLQAFLNTLKPVNNISSNIRTNPLSTGWRNGPFYFTLDLTEKIDQDFRFTEDFMEFALNGNKNRERFNFSETGIDLNYYREFAIGVSYNYEDEFQIGARVKLLFGLANITTRLSDITLKASEEEWELNSSIMLDVNGPFLYIPVDSAGYVILDSIDVDPALEDDYMAALLDNVGTIMGIHNPGIGIDFGFSFSPIENLSFSASVNDLGFIRWKGDAYHFEQDGSLEWEGIEVKLDDDRDYGEMLLDSVENQFNFTSSMEPYTNFLSGKLYLGAAYEINEMVKFGIVNKTRIYHTRFFNHLTLSANVRPIRMFSATLSYSIIGKNYSNFGLGLALKAGPFNLYFITDQAPGGYLWPETINSFNMRFGMNLVFGCAKIPKKLRDRPLID